MKRKISAVCLLIPVLAILLFIFGSCPVLAAEGLRYSCSAQVYEAVEKERLNAFTKSTGIPVELKVISSFAAVERLVNGMSDVASTAERLPRSKQDAGFVETPFCKDPLVVIANEQCTVTNLTEEQLRGIFSGEITNWKQLGGPERVIIRIVPGRQTAAYNTFHGLVMRGREIQYDLMTSLSTTVIEATKRFPWSISFIAQGAAKSHREGLKLIKVDGLAPEDKGYPYYQVFSFVTKGQPTGTVKALVDYAWSESGKNILLSRGILPIAGPAK